MRKFLFAAFAMLLCSALHAGEEAPRLSAEDIPAPIVRTEVGDWALYVLDDGSSLKLTVLERWNEHDDDFLVIQSERTPKGKGRRRKAVVDTDQVSVRERVDDARDLGTEDFVTEADIFVDRRKLRAAVVNYVEDGDVVRQSWFSDDVPVFGLVRGVRLEGSKKTIALDLKEFGSAENGEQ
jgi:hypothetical protein